AALRDPGAGAGGGPPLGDPPGRSRGMSATLALLQQAFVQDALKAALIVAVICSYLGVFVVLKRIVFVGAALAEISSLGAALAFVPAVSATFGWLFARMHAPAAMEHYEPLILALLLMLAAV